MRLFSATLFALFLLSAATAADLERGRTIYSQICFNCHGPHLEGGQGPSLKDQYWQHGSSPDAILNTINKGVPGSPMIAFDAVFPESDRLALRDFILSEQEGLREMVRSVYAREPFKGKRFSPELFAGVESESQTPLPENHLYMDRNADGVMRVTAKLHVRTADEYGFSIRPIGRTTVYLNGEEIHYDDEATDKKTHFSKATHLEPGIHEVEIFHEEKVANSYRFSGSLRGGGQVFALNGRSLEGNIPVVIKAGPVAKVVRKRIEGLPPRVLLCLLPNAVIVAYDPENGGVVKAWHSAEINQTPSLPDRSAKPSEIKGEPISSAMNAPVVSGPVRLLSYEIAGDSVVIRSRIGDADTETRVVPDGARSYRLETR